MTDPFGESTGWRAEAFRDVTRFGVGLHLWRRIDGVVHYVEAGELTIVRLTEEDAGTFRPPSLRLEDGMAVAVLGALSSWHGGTSEVRTLRRDYEAERARVDKLTAAVLDRLART